MRSLVNFEWKPFFHRLYVLSTEADIFDRSAIVAFYFSFSLFPLLFFLISVFGMVIETAGEFKKEVLAYLNQVMPGAVFVLVRNTLVEIAANSTGGKLTIGLAATLWSASAGVDGLRSSLNSIYGLRDRRSWPRLKLESLGLTLVVLILAAVVLAIVFYGWQLVELATASLGYRITSPYVLISIQWISILLVMLFACEIIFNLLPDFRKFTWRWVTPGSVVAIALWLLLSSSFRTYISYFNTYDRAYGSLGAVIIMMLWLYLTALAVMIGGAINAVTAGKDEEIAIEVNDEIAREQE